MDDSQLAALAKAATPGPWRGDTRTVDDAHGNAVAMVNLAIDAYTAAATTNHIAAWSPERALAALAVIEAVREHVDCDPDYSFGDLKQALVAWDALAMTKGSEG